MTTVGLTDCGLQCKVACGCNTANGWYRAVPSGNYTSRTSVKSYDFVIGDDGKLASSGTTLSSTGRTLSGSTKSLSAGGSTITCTKQTCSDGYTATEPLSYFDYVTETLRHGQICYKVTGCKLYYANKNIASGTTGATSHNGIECYDVLCSDENANWLASKTGYDHYTNVSSQSSYGNTCYTGRYHNITWCPSGQSVRSGCPDGQYTSASQQVECTECDVTGDDICRECSTCPTKVDVGSCEVGTTTNIAASQDECGIYYTAKRDKTHAEDCGSDYTSVPSGYHCDSYTSPCGFTCYNNCEKHNYTCSATGGTYKYDSASAATPHASSSSSATKTCSCRATTTGTCWKQGSHNWTCGGSQYSTNSSSFTNAEFSHYQYCTNDTTETNTTKCYKEGKIYYCDVRGSLGCDDLGSAVTATCHVNLSIQPRDSGVTIQEEPSASVAYSCDCHSGTDSGSIGMNGGVGYFSSGSFNASDKGGGLCTSCSISITSVNPDPISAYDTTTGKSVSCEIVIGSGDSVDHDHNYECTTFGTKAGKSDFVDPVFVDYQECTICGATNSTKCYKDNHSHSYYCDSGTTNKSSYSNPVDKGYQKCDCGKVGPLKCWIEEEDTPTWYTHSSGCGKIGASTEDCNVYLCISGTSSSAWQWSGECYTGLSGHRYDDANQTCSGTNHSHTISNTHPAYSTEASCTLVYEAMCSEISIRCDGSLTRK